MCNSAMIMHVKSKRIWGKRSWTNLGYNPGVFTEELDEVVKELSTDDRSHPGIRNEHIRNTSHTHYRSAYSKKRV